MIQMSSQVSDRYRPQQQQHQKRHHRHHNHHHQHHNNTTNINQQQQQPQQQQPQPQQQQNDFFNSSVNVNRFFSTERNNGSRYIHSSGNGNMNVAATDGHPHNHNHNHNHNASVFEPIRIIQKDVKNKYANNKSSSTQASNKKSVSPSPSVASSGSSTNSGTNKNGNKNNNSNSSSSSNNNNNNNTNNTNRNSKSYNGNSMQSMNTHRINVNTSTNSNVNTNTSTNISTTPLNIQQSRYSNNRLRYMDQQKSHQFGEQNARPNNLMGTIDGFNLNLHPSIIKTNFAPSVPQQKVRSGLSGSFMAVNGRKLVYDSIIFRELRYRARMSEIPMPIDLFNGTDWDSLSQKIWAKFEQRRQTRDIFEKKMQLWKNLREVVEVPRRGQMSLHMVGSTISGFALDTSDVDMCIVSRLATTLPDLRHEAFAVLNDLRIYLQENCQSFSQNLNYIPAKVPILRFEHPENNIEVDLNYNNCVGIRNSHLLYLYTLLDWRLQPLALIVKLWAQHHDINNAKDLTISSYSLILMVINYLQCGVQPPILPSLQAAYPEQFEYHDLNHVEIMDVGVFLKPTDTDNKQTLGELFVGFLQYYSNFKFERYAISVRAGRLLPIEECRNYKNESDWRQLCIEEPFDRSNAARSCCDERIFERIKKIFTKSWHLLRDTKDLEQLFSDEILEPPAHAYYDNNYSRILYHPMDYFLR